MMNRNYRVISVYMPFYHHLSVSKIEVPGLLNKLFQNQLIQLLFIFLLLKNVLVNRYSAQATKSVIIHFAAKIGFYLSKHEKDLSAEALETANIPFSFNNLTTSGIHL